MVHLLPLVTVGKDIYQVKALYPRLTEVIGAVISFFVKKRNQNIRHIQGIPLGALTLYHRPFQHTLEAHRLGGL
jgi:hypothetical protein